MWRAGCHVGINGPSFWGQAQTGDASKIIDTTPSKVLRRLKQQLGIRSGTELSAPALYGLGQGQHTVKAYLLKHCTPSPAFSHTDILQALTALQQHSPHSQWCTSRQPDGTSHLLLMRSGCSLRVRLEESLLYTDLLVRGDFQSIDLSFMGVPKQLSSQADLTEVLQHLEDAHTCAGASAACKGKYDSILPQKESYVNQQGQICGYKDDEWLLTKDGLFPSTVRSAACTRLVRQDTLLCKPCKHLQRSQLDSTLRRTQQPGQKLSRARPQTETYEQAAKRAKDAQAELRNCKRREARLEQKVASLQSGIQELSCIRRAISNWRAANDV